MATKIKSLTIVNQQGSHAYHVGNIVNGLLLAKIEDKSMEYPKSLEIIYQGFTNSGELVFEAINAPIDVEYEPA